MLRAAAVVFLHGLAKKPPKDKLLEIWNWGISRGNPMPSVFAPPNVGIDLPAEGFPVGLCYYADVFYGEDYESDLKAYYEAAMDGDQNLEIAAEVRVAGTPPAPIQPANEREERFLAAFEAKLRAQPALTDTAAGGSLEGGLSGLEIASWLPGPVKEAIIKKAAMEAYYYLFDKEYTRSGDGARFRVRATLRQRLLDALALAAGKADKTILVSHSMGTMIAYDVLRNCPQCPPVDTLITLGSPLGVEEVQDELKAPGASTVDFPAATLARWINVYDPLDPVCGADPRFANDYASVQGKSVVDIKESNWGNWRHTITHYLAGSRLRDELRRAIGLA